MPKVKKHHLILFLGIVLTLILYLLLFLSFLTLQRNYIQNSGNLTVLVLDYHHIMNSANARDTSITVENFSAQMALLDEFGYKTITYDQWYNYTKKLGQIPMKSVILEFDDGYKDVLTNAIPVMNQYGYVGVAGIITNNVSDKSGLYMNWTDINFLINRGWQIASHSEDHKNMSNLTLNQIKVELMGSKNAIGDYLNRTPSLFVYPYGSCNTTLDNECSLYYRMCACLFATPKEDFSAYFLSKNADYISGLRRIIIVNTTTYDQFRNVSDTFLNLLYPL